MSTSTVQVKNISGSTSDGEIRDFFSFCGKIADIKVTTEGETKSADVTFEKETAKKTALLLNNTQLGKNHISVTSTSDDSAEDAPFTKNTDRDSDDITQEEKPRARILAEYLAHGYVIGDATLQKGIELDSKHGVSARFLNTLQGFDQKLHATDRAKATDETYGISARAGSLWAGLGSYFEKAANTPTGQKIVKFYEEGSKQVQDIHAEARRLADLKTEESGGAYKAAGLERVFGKDEKKDGTGEGHGAASGSVGGEPVGTMNPSNPAPSNPVPGVASEKIN